MTPLRFDRLETRLVPAGQVVPAQVAELAPLTPADLDTDAIAADAGVESAETLTAEPGRRGRCECLPCQAVTSADTTPSATEPSRTAVSPAPTAEAPSAEVAASPTPAEPLPEASATRGPTVAFAAPAVTRPVDAWAEQPPTVWPRTRLSISAELDLPLTAAPDAVVVNATVSHSTTSGSDPVLASAGLSV